MTRYRSRYFQTQLGIHCFIMEKNKLFPCHHNIVFLREEKEKEKRIAVCMFLLVCTGGHSQSAAQASFYQTTSSCIQLSDFIYNHTSYSAGESNQPAAPNFLPPPDELYHWTLGRRRDRALVKPCSRKVDLATERHS